MIQHYGQVCYVSAMLVLRFLVVEVESAIYRVLLQRSIRHWMPTCQLLTTCLSRRNSPNYNENQQQTILRRRISEKLEDGDVRGAIRLASSDDTIAPHDETTLAALRLKHPPRRIISGDESLFISNENDTHLPLSVMERDIVDSIKSFPAGSAGGIDGLRPQHLKDLTNAQNGEAGQRLISRLTDFANVCLSGKVPPSIRPHFLRRILVCAEQERRLH